MREDQICKLFIKQLRVFETLGEVKAKELVYYHVPNGGSRKTQLEGYNFKKLGVKAGVPDYQFIWTQGSFPQMGFIEFKTQKGRLTDSQKEFQQKCIALKIPYEIARSVDDGLGILKKWEVLK